MKIDIVTYANPHIRLVEDVVQCNGELDDAQTVPREMDINDQCRIQTRPM